MLLLVLVAKGYTVTRARLRQASAIKVTIFISCYCITYIILFFMEKNYFDPGEVNPGILSSGFVRMSLLFRFYTFTSQWPGTD